MSNEFSHLSPSDRKLLQARAEQFADAQRQGAANDWDAYCGGLDPAMRLNLLHTMVKMDLDYRWSHGEQPQLEEYVQWHPEIGTLDDLPADLICEEFRLRSKWGNGADLTGYAVRFPKQFEAVKREIGREQSPSNRTISTTDSECPVMAPGPTRPDAEGPHSSPSLPKAGIYEKTTRLGRGSFGEVWKAIAPGGVEVAIKVVTQAIDRDGAQRELHSLELVKNLRHPCLLSTHGFWIENDQLHIAMELAECSLRDKFKECRSQNLPGIPRDQLLYFVKCAADGLDFLHSKGVVHRDVKPDNILLQQGHAKVADFGLARLQERAKLNESLVGTVRYMAPEALTGKGSGPQSDQYSLAYAYAELRQGRPPIDAENQIEVMTKTLESEPDLDGLPPQEAAAVRRALAKRPEERFASCSEFVDALSNATQVIPSNWMNRGSDARTASPITGKRRKVILGIGIFLLLGCLGIAAYLLIPRDSRVASDGSSTSGLEEAKHSGPEKAKHSGPEKAKQGSGGDKQSELLPMPRVVENMIVNSVGMKLKLIPKGSFMMGSPETELDRDPDEGPLHQVEISRPFYIGIYEVTRLQFNDVMHPDHAPIREPTLPIDDISYNKAVKFCEKLNANEKEMEAGRRYRLPTEAEWEYACRAQTKTPFSLGDDLGAGDANVDATEPYGRGKKGAAPSKTSPVDSYRPNAWGLYNMHGNVWEWCSDRYSEKTYDVGKAIDPVGPAEGERRVLRGGSFQSFAVDARSARRYKDEPDRQSSEYGFRVVMTFETGFNPGAPPR